MAKVSSRSEELRNRSEVIIDYARNLDDHRTSFDEECRKIQYGDSERSLSDLIRKDAHILKQKTRRAYDSCLCKSDDAARSIHRRRPACTKTAQTHSQEANPCEQGFPFRSFLMEDRDDVVELNKQQEMSAEEFVSHIFDERKLLISSKGARIENKPFSNALEVLSSDKDVFIMELLSEAPYCLPHKCITCPKSNTGQTVSASFSMREMKRKLKHTFGSRRKSSDKLPKLGTNSAKLLGHDCIYSGVETNTNAESKKILAKKQGLKVEKMEKEPIFVCAAESVRKKIDFSSDRLCVKHEADDSWEARIRGLNAVSRVQNPWRVISSLGVEPCLSPRRESRYVCGSRSRTSKGVDGTTDTPSPETSTDDEEARDERPSPTPNMVFNDMPNTDKTNNINAQRMHCKMDSISDTFQGRVDEFPSSPTLEPRDDGKDQELYPSPISVLDQFFIDDSSSPSNNALQSARGVLKPRCLSFEEQKPESSSYDTPRGADPLVHERDYTISSYVHMIFEASCLSWDQLSATRPMPEELILHPSLSDQARFLMFDSHFDTRLLFDHINEVLLEKQRSHFVSSYWPSLAKPLEEVVRDEIMREAEFYLLPCTERRTLDELVAKDLSGPPLRPDVRTEAEEIIVLISEDILEESVLDVLLQLHS